ncbi:MAG TPA: hypothetical protein VGI45_09085 [Terracidiphilus sp.]|jgi:hypothetical protein
MSSNSIIGAGATISFSAHSANTFQPFAQIQTFTITPPTVSSDEITNLSSPLVGTAVVVERRPTKIDPGKFSATVVYDPSDTSLANVRTFFNAQTIADFKVQLPKGASQSSTGDLYQFTGFFETYPMPSGLTVDKHVEATVGVQLTSTWSFTAGS